MKNISKYVALTGVCTVFLCSMYAGVGHAGDVKLKTSIKAQYNSNNNNDLDTVDAESTTGETIEAKVTLYGDINEDFSFFTQARAVKNYGEGGSIDTDTGESTGRDDFFELRQYWVEYDGLANYLPFSIRAGRQRIREERALWWNRDFDAVTLMYDGSLFTGFLSVGQNLGEYRSNKDGFQEDDEGLFRILGETSWQWQPEHFFEARFASQDDHSGLNDVGSLVKGDNRDDEDADLLWFGVRAKGTVDVPSSKQFGHISYRADIMGVTGQKDVETTTDSGNNTRTVTGHTEQDVFGWGADVGVDVALSSSSERSPVISLGYAFGSGDDDAADGDDENFQQTGLDGNTSYLPGGVNTSHYNYGSVLRPDLSNIHILTAGVTVPVLKDSSVAAVYHYYHLAEEASSIPTSGINASFNGTERQIGQGLDLILNTNVSEELNWTKKGMDKIGLKATLGAFQSGDAYGNAEDEMAYRAQVDLSFRF